MSTYHEKLRKRPRICYFDPDEPNTDEYVYCEKCCDFVYEYCSIHGPLLVIPDDKVIFKESSSNISKAVQTIPHVFLYLATSNIPGAGIGVFATLTLPQGVRFGPYCGERVKSSDDNSGYSWQIYKENKPYHIISAEDPNSSNWMRYVNCARHFQEQNLVAYQYKGDIYYRTINIIPKNTELLVFYGTEYAASLQIDLKKYNSNKYYHEIREAASQKLNTINRLEMVEAKEEELHNNMNTITTLEIASDEIIKNEINTEFEIIDNFTYIDDNNNENKEKQDNSDGFDLQAKSYFTQQYDLDPNPTEDVKDMYLPKCEAENNDIKFQIKNEQETSKTKEWYCQICNKTMSEKSRNRHELNVHKSDSRYDCQFCSYKANSKYNYDRHVKVHSNDIFKCQICAFVTNTNKNLRQHKRRKHEDKNKSMLKCNLCSLVTTDKVYFDRHITLHSINNIYKCPVCKFVTNTNRNLNAHIKRMHGEDNIIKFENLIQCDYCNYKIPQKNVMEHHKVLHFSDNVMKCSKCDYLTKKSRDLKAHETTHR